MNKAIDKGFRSCRFVSTIVKHPVSLLVSDGSFKNCISFFVFSFFLHYNHSSNFWQCNSSHGVEPVRTNTYTDFTLKHV